jgi:protein-S-isoprenylcysteine O-methyltransferase Ste14
VRSVGSSTRHFDGSVANRGPVIGDDRVRLTKPDRDQVALDESNGGEARELPFIASMVLVALVALLIAALFFSSAIGPDNGWIIASLACLITLTIGLILSRTFSRAIGNLETPAPRRDD